MWGKCLSGEGRTEQKKRKKERKGKEKKRKGQKKKKKEEGILSALAEQRQEPRGGWPGKGCHVTSQLTPLVSSPRPIGCSSQHAIDRSAQTPYQVPSELGIFSQEVAELFGIQYSHSAQALVQAEHPVLLHPVGIPQLAGRRSDCVYLAQEVEKVQGAGIDQEYFPKGEITEFGNCVFLGEGMHVDVDVPLVV